MGATFTSTDKIDTKYYGYRIYRILPNGPLSKVNTITELEDFIIPPLGMENDKVSFNKYLSSRKDLPTDLQLYSIKTRSFSTITIKPSDDWCKDLSTKSFLGANVRFENWAIAHKNVLRITKIKPNSVFVGKNIIPNDDFIIALKRIDSDIISLNQEDKEPLSFFSELIDVLENSEVEFIIYNQKTHYKSVVVKLERKKNGEILGCDVAYGQLHAFPQKLDYMNDSNLNIDNKSKFYNDNKNTESNYIANKEDIENIDIKENENLNQNNEININNQPKEDNVDIVNKKISNEFNALEEE